MTGGSGLHGFDVITLSGMVGGAVVGLFAGVRTGSVVAAKLLRRVSDVNHPESVANDKGRKYDA